MGERMDYVDAIVEGIEWRKQNPAASHENLEARADQFAEAWGESDGHYWNVRSGFIKGATQK